MTGLLVSVRSADEAVTALAGGADLIDVKEPRNGTLGAADPAVWRAVSAVVGGRTPTSVALGELVAFDSSTTQDLARIQFAKLGLSACRDRPDWAQAWRESLNTLPREVEAVAVVYADWRAAAAPTPEAIITQAAALHCGAVLFDTFDKTQGDLLDHLGVEQLDLLSSLIRKHAMRIVLGGSLNTRSAAQLLSLHPDYLAVRGAVCRQGRTGAIDGRLVEDLVRVVHRENDANRSRTGPAQCPLKTR